MCNKACNILGNYCWDHKLSTAVHITGWGKNASDGVRRSVWESGTVAVVWANGDTEAPRDTYSCVICDNNVCRCPALRGVLYKEVVTKKSYWNWLEGNSSEDAESGVLREPIAANPDGTED